jgi:hypothetical protein
MQKKLSFYLLPLLLAATPLVALTPAKAKINQKQKTKKFVAPDTEIKTLETSPFKDVSHEYMKGFAAPEEDEDDIQQKKLRTEIPQISEYALFKHIFDLYQTIELVTLPVFNRNGWKDLELLCGEHKEHVNLVHFLKRTQTKIGEAFLGFTLSHPISDVTALQNRQNVVKEFVANKALSHTCKDALARVAAVENNLFFFWETESDYNLKAISSYFFTSNLPGLKELKKANTNPYAMEALCFKGRLFSYSVPAILPALAFWVTKKSHYAVTSSRPYNKLQASAEFQALEKKLKTVLSTATPEQKKAFLENLEKEDKSGWFWTQRDNIKDLLGKWTWDSVTINGTHCSYSEAVERVGVYEAQKLFNARYSRYFSPQKQAHSAAQATVGLDKVLPFTGTERQAFTRAFEKSFGPLPEEHGKVLSLWNPQNQELNKNSRAYAARAFVNNNNPFVSELRNVNSLKEIKGVDLTKLDHGNMAYSLEQAFEGFGFFDKYTFGDKRKFFSLVKEYVATKPGGISQDLIDKATLGVNTVANFHLYGTGFLYALEAGTLYYTYSREKSYNELTNYVHAQMMAVATVVHAMETLSSEIKHNNALRNGLDHQKQLTALFDTKSALISQKMHKLVTLLLSDTFTGTPSYFCFKGRVLAAYALMREIKNDLAPALLALGEVDAYLSCATLYQDYEDKPNGFCFVTYLDQDTPYLNFNGMWNPFIPSKKAVANSIELGGSKPLNVILTGPNAGGKSTFSKGLTLNVLLAQTVGIAPGQELVITPFEKINTYMNITDDTAGGNSLFKSEVLRAQSLLKTIADLDKKKFSFSIMDEMFSGTSPREGEAAGYAVAKNLGANTNSIAVIATHFPKLKELEKTTGNFKNYQVRVAYAADGSFTYPFKLEEGAADQNVAIAILQQQGFDSSILNDAQDLLKVTPSATV